MRWTFGKTAVVALALTGLVACDDSTGLDFEPILVSDTVTVAAPLPQNEQLPTALDITSNGAFGVNGGRFPELPRDALQWDFAVRVEDGELLLIPARGIGLNSRAALTQAIAGAVFENVREAPGQSTFSDSTGVVMREGAVYVGRSRESTNVFGGVCVQFAKFQPTEVDVAAGRVHFRIVTNEQCGDPRLVPVDD